MMGMLRHFFRVLHKPYHVASAETIDDYVGSLDPDRAVEWPPPRNGPCWCGSGLKYKKCCLPRSRT